MKLLSLLALFLALQVFADDDAVEFEAELSKPVVDYHPCDNNHGDCHAMASCHFQQDMLMCICHDGYEGDGKECRKIPSCMINHGGCDANASCEEKEYGEVCKCNEGYIGNGLKCEEISPCALNHGGCHPNASCDYIFKISGEVLCLCHRGYEGDGYECEKVPTCGVNNGGCDENAKCENTEYGSECTCLEGFEGNGVDCKTSENSVGEATEYCWRDHNKKVHCAKYVAEVELSDEAMPMPKDRYWVDDGCHTDKGKGKGKNKYLKDDFDGTFKNPTTFESGVRCCHNDRKCTSPKKCPGDYSLEAAQLICAEEGAQLCTKEQLLSEICCGTGGQCNHYPVWTSTKEPNPCLVENGGCDDNAMCHNYYGTPQCTCKGGYFGDGVVCQKMLFWVDDGCHTKKGKGKGKNKYLKDDFEGSYKDPTSFKAGVRCCHSDSKCTSPKKCPGDYSMNEAKAICAKVGAQLCTKQQLLSEICCSTGGQCNHYPVWTSTSNNDAALYAEMENSLGVLVESESTQYFLFLVLLCTFAFVLGYYMSNHNRKTQELEMELTDYNTLRH